MIYLCCITFFYFLQSQNCINSVNTCSYIIGSLPTYLTQTNKLYKGNVTYNRNSNKSLLTFTFVAWSQTYCCEGRNKLYLNSTRCQKVTNKSINSTPHERRNQRT